MDKKISPATYFDFTYYKKQFLISLPSKNSYYYEKR